MDTEAVTCPLTDEHQRGGMRLTDLSITVPAAGIEDFVWTWFNECLIQDHVLDALRKAKLSGFEVKPVKANTERESSIAVPMLHELIVTGWGGMAQVKSGISVISRCPGCGHTTYSGVSDSSRILDVSEWDGSDLFLVWPLPRYIFITDRVANLIRETMWQGCKIMNPNNIKSDGFTPGRLSYYFPDTTARKIGLPLRIY